MAELTKNKYNNQRERIKVTSTTLQERMNSCTNRQNNSPFYVKDKQEASNNHGLIKKMIVSLVIFGILYAMSLVKAPFMETAMKQVQTIYEQQIDMGKTQQVFESIGESINTMMDNSQE
jgi:hypothetical protein